MAGSKNVESALDWLLSHENDGDIDEPIKKVPKGQTLASSGPAPVTKSIKCVETGRLFRNAMEAQAYAERTGRTQFEETTEVKKPLTEEEKKQKVAELKALAAQRRAEREGLEKVEDIDREKKRREQGQESIKKKERERLRAEIAKDKAERRARGGRLAGKLGVDGYNPSIDQNDDRRNDACPTST